MRVVSSQVEFNEAVASGVAVEVREGVFEASGSATVTAFGSATVYAFGSATVYAFDSATVYASGSATVYAFDSATVTASGSATVTASGSTAVTASGSATVTAFGLAIVTASSDLNAVFVHSSATTVTGGTVIVVPPVASVAEWLARYCIEVSDGVVTLYKAVDGGFKSPHGFDYTPGTVPVAPDWDRGESECGGGLHFSPTPHHAMAFNIEASRFVACPINVEDIRAPAPNDRFPEKIKARGCSGPVFEVDADGNRVDTNEAANAPLGEEQ